MSKASILLVDDERIVRAALSDDLRASGYEVTSAPGGEAGLAAFGKSRPDLVLLDVMMPGMDGYEVCRRLRALDREVPVVFLSALDGEVDQIRGLDVGANDYVSKTASGAMLQARIRAALEHARRVSLCSAPAGMTKTEADIYRLLKSAPGRYFSYREIFADICGEGYYADEGAVRSHVSRLRGKLPAGETVEAKRGRGYALLRV